MHRYLLLIAAVSCSGEDLLPGVPDIQVCASATDNVCVSPLYLGGFAIGATHPASLELRNNGSALLSIENVQVLSGNVAIDTAPTTVARFSAAPLTLSLTPATGSNTARLLIVSNDPDSGRLEVDVTFDGVTSALVFCPTPGANTTPEVCSETMTLRLPAVGINQSSEATVLVYNTGGADLDVADAHITDNSSTPNELSIATETSAGRLPSHHDSPMVVRYTPRDITPDDLQVHLEATDADGAIYYAILSVVADTPGNQPPVADVVEYDTGLTVLVDRRVGSGIWLDGRGSVDPEGDPLQYTWSVIAAPPGSSASLETPAAKLTRFEPDLLGHYEVALEVEDALGNTDTATIPITVDPELALTVKVTWGETVGDVDLHVVPSGQPLFGALDCYFQQPTRDWGAQNRLDDDPSLLVDDVSGSGSERVVVRRPANGTYDIYANYFEAAGTQPAEVTIEVLGDDETASYGTATRSLADTCETWRVGTLDWPSRVFTPETTANTSQCYAGGAP